MWLWLVLGGGALLLLGSKKSGSSRGGGSVSWGPGGDVNTQWANRAAQSTAPDLPGGLSFDDGGASASSATITSDAAAIGLSDEEYGNMLGAAAADLGQSGSGDAAPLASTDAPAGADAANAIVSGYRVRGVVGQLVHYGEVHGRTGAPIVRDQMNKPFMFTPEGHLVAA